MADVSGATSEDETRLAQGQLISPVDLDRLARAIKDGTAPQRPTSANVALDFAVLVLAVAFLASAWTALHHLRPAVGVSYNQGTASNFGPLKSLDLGTARSGVGLWSAGASAQEVDLVPGSAIATTLVLPVNPGLCGQIVKKLRSGSCDHGVLATHGLIKAVWQSPQPVGLVLPGNGLDTSTLSLQLGLGSSSATSLAAADPSVAPPTDVWVSVGNSAEWCTLEPTAATTLRIKSVLKTFTVPKEDFFSDSCTSGYQGPQGLTLAVMPVAGGPAMTELVGATELSLGATTRSVDASDLGGVLQLGAAGSATLDPPAEVTLVGDARGIEVTFQFLVEGSRVLGAGLTVLGQATGAWDGPPSLEPSLVTSWWDRESAVAVPLFLALCGLFFNVLARLMSDAQKRWFPFADAVPALKPTPEPSKREGGTI